MTLKLYLTKSSFIRPFTSSLLLRVVKVTESRPKGSKSVYS